MWGPRPDAHGHGARGVPGAWGCLAAVVPKPDGPLLGVRPRSGWRHGATLTPLHDGRVPLLAAAGVRARAGRVRVTAQAKKFRARCRSSRCSSPSASMDVMPWTSTITLRSSPVMPSKARRSVRPASWSRSPLMPTRTELPLRWTPMVINAVSSHPQAPGLEVSPSWRVRPPGRVQDALRGVGAHRRADHHQEAGLRDLQRCPGRPRTVRDCAVRGLAVLRRVRGQQAA